MSFIKTTGERSDFLSRSDTENLKGVFTCMVLLSHLHGRVSLFSFSLLGTIFSAFGYLAVAGFFFVSGFGLRSGLQQRDGYLKYFCKRKIFPFYVICCCIIVIYLLRDVLIYNSLDIPALLQSFFFGKTIVDNGWYLQAQLVLYVVFYLAYRFSEKGLVWVAISLIIYCALCACAGLPTTWYESVLCFPLGMLFAKYKNECVKSLENNGKVLLAAIAMLLGFLITLFLGNKQILPEAVRIVVKMCSAAVFIGFVFVGCTCIYIKNPITTFLGKYSLEIYVLQGLFLTGFRPIIHNDWLYMATVIVATLAAAMVVKPLFSKIRALTMEKF